MYIRVLSRQLEREMDGYQLVSPYDTNVFDYIVAEIGSGVWGTPINFDGFCVLAALLHDI